MYNCGLVLEGGGSRAIFTSGVLDAFMENNIEFPYIVGASAGTCNAVSYISKSLHRQRDITLNYINDKRYMSPSSFLLNGEYMNYDWIFGELSYDIYPINQDIYDEANCKLVCAVTNAQTGKAEYLIPKTMRRRGCPALRASCALPIAEKGVRINGRLYYDGGIADSIPIERAFKDGCKKTVVILTQDVDYVKQPIKIRMLLDMYYKKYPNLINALLNRHELYNEQTELVKRYENEGSALVIRPKSALNCTALEKSTIKLQAIYDLGYEQGLDSIERVKSFINK